MNKVNDENNRWAFASVEEALAWTVTRREQKINVALDALGEYAQNEQQAFENLSRYLNCLLQVQKQGVEVAVAVKLSAIGLSVSRGLAEENLQRIISVAQEAGSIVEIDMEGTPSVADTLLVAQNNVEGCPGMVIALQAYLDRTPEDIEACQKAGLKVRLVKGAYRGDSEDFGEIQKKFSDCFELLMASGSSFDVGTHDPVLIESMKSKLDVEGRKKIGFGFLKGLSDKTKVALAKDGFKVAEYVPFGSNSRPYIMRRNVYLNRLQELGLAPAN